MADTFSVIDEDDSRTKPSLDEDLELYDEIGPYSRQQLMQFLLLALVTLPIGFSCTSPVFLDFSPEVRCLTATESAIESTNECGITEQDVCSYVHNNESLACGHFEFSNATMTTTTVTEFSLVCQSAHLAPLASSAYYSGTIFVPMIVNSFADAFGRRRLVIGLLILLSVSTAASSVATHYLMYVICRALEGGATIAAAFTTVTLIYETNKPKQIPVLISLYYSAWAAGFYLLVLSSYFMRTWRDLLRLESIYTALAALCMIFSDESPLHNIAKGNYGDAFKFYRRVARSNNRCLGRGWKDKLAVITVEQQNKEVGFLSLCCYGRHLCMIFTVTMYIAFTCGLIQFGLMLNSVNLPMSLRASFAATTLTNFPANYLFYYCSKRYGRRTSVVVLLGTTGVLLLLSTLFRNMGLCDFGSENQFQSPWVVLSLITVLVGQMAVCAASNLFTGVYIQEMFPTPLRARANMLGAAFLGLGITIAPFALQAMPHPTWLPMVMMATFALIASVLAELVLPETADLVADNRQLNSMEQASSFYASSSHAAMQF